VPTATRPIHTIGAAVAMDPVRNRLVLFGGANNAWTGSDEHWEYTPPVATEPFGPNCLPSSSYYAVGLAARGTSWSGGLHVAAGSVSTLALFAVGLGNTWWNGVPLPLPLGALGLPQCDLLVEPRWTALAPVHPVLGGVWAEFQLAVPDVPALYGVDLYTQAFALGPGSFAAASRGVRAQVW
jgi:hypothetical protein